MNENISNINNPSSDTNSSSAGVRRLNAFNAKLFNALLDSISSGDNSLSQAVARQATIIDDTWVQQIEDCIFSIENILTKPRSFIQENRELVRIEKARKTDAIAVRHLASHTENIKKINDDGSIQPSKILASNLEVDIGLYENRFVYTLLLRLYTFVKQRFDAINMLKSEDTTCLSMNSSFPFGNANVNCKFDISIVTPSDLHDLVEKNNRTLHRLSDIIKRINILKKSNVAKILSKYPLVSPPIMKTNLLRVQKDYHNCYNLWLFISSYDAVGYSVNVSEKALPFDDDYFTDLSKVVAESVTCMLSNNTLRTSIFENVKLTKKRKISYKVVRRIDLAKKHTLSMPVPADVIVNQFYFEKIKSMVKDISAQSSAGDVEEHYHIDPNFKRLFKGLNKINNAIFEDILKLDYESNDKKHVSALARKKAEVKKQSELCDKYELLYKLKRDEANLALRKFNNQKDKLSKLNDELYILEFRQQQEKILKQAKKIAKKNKNNTK